MDPSHSFYFHQWCIDKSEYLLFVQTGKYFRTQNNFLLCTDLLRYKNKDYIVIMIVRIVLTILFKIILLYLIKLYKRDFKPSDDYWTLILNHILT